MRILLIGGTPAEHAGPSGPTWDGHKDFAASSYGYGIGLLRACALADEEVASRVEIGVRDFPVARTQRALTDGDIEAILAWQPDVVGLSCACWSVHALVETAARLRAAAPRIRLLAGGPAFAGAPAALAHASPALDVIGYGEGETAFVELCRRGFADLGEVPGIVWRSEGRLVENPPPAPVDLAALPSPYLDAGFRPSSEAVLFEPSRGCRYRCAFCGWSTLRGRVRYAPRDRVAAEVAWAVRSGYRAANFCDTAVNHDTGHMRDLVGALLEGDPDRALGMSVFLRHEELDDEQLELLARRPMDEVILGVESANPAALRSCGKRPLSFADFERKLEALGRVGCRVTMSLMSGLPGDTIESFERTLDWAEGLVETMPEVIGSVCCFWLAVLPGTRYEALADKHGFEAAPRGTPYIVRSRDFAPEQLIRVARTLVDRVEHNPRLRCEQVHREAAELTRAEDLVPMLAGGGRPVSPPCAAPARSAPDGERLIRPWAPGQERAGWVLRAAGPGPGETIFRFARASAPSVEVEVRVSARDERRPRPCFSRTARHELSYLGQDARARCGPTLDGLMRAVHALVERNEA